MLRTFWLAPALLLACGSTTLPDDPATTPADHADAAPDDDATPNAADAGTVDPTDFDQTCAVNADCALVTAARVCGAPCGPCPGEAVAATAKAAFEAAVARLTCAKAPPSGVSCGACEERRAVCEADRCVAVPVPPPLSAGNYSTACSTADDCTAIFAGDACAACKCPNAAIAASARASYDTDAASARCGATGQACVADCASPTLACVGGTCALTPP